MTGSSCVSDSDCSGSFTCQNDVCAAAGLWPPNAIEVFTYIMIPWIVGVGNVGGLGGGVVKVPFLMLLLNYSSKEATFIAYCVLFGSCLSNSTLIMFKKHPHKKKPLIDFNIVMIINPMVLLGTNIGIFLNVLLPEIAAALLFIVFLTSMLPFLFKKGLKQRELRRKMLLASGEQSKDEEKPCLVRLIQNADQSDNSNEGTGDTKDELQQSSESNSLLESSQEGNIQKSVSNKVSDDVLNNEEVKWLFREDENQFQGKKLTLLIVIFLSVQMFVFLRGGKGLASFVGITTCSTWYWLMCVGIVGVVIIALFLIRFCLVKWETKRRNIIEKYQLQDMDHFKDEIDFLNPMKYAQFSLAGFGAGCLAGTFGVGAGLALVPIILAAGVSPQITAATSGFNYFFISLTTIIQVFTNDYLTIEEIVWFSFLSFIGGFACAKLIYHLVEKHKAAHVVVFIVFGLAILNIVSFIVYLIRKDIQSGWSSLTSVSPFCSQ